jgi:hypothetical protein
MMMMALRKAENPFESRNKHYKSFNACVAELWTEILN